MTAHTHENCPEYEDGDIVFLYERGGPVPVRPFAGEWCDECTKGMERVQ